MPSKREDRKEQSQLSPQTQAIIDTLEKEGKLLRTDGRTHSLKNIRADLAKFDGVFNRIATALDGQKDYFDKMGNMNKELLEQQKNEEALKQVAPDASESTNSVSEDTSQKTRKEKTESGGVTSLLKSILPSGNMMKNLAMAGGGMFLAYNFVKGFIDEKSNGAFTEFEDSMIETFKKVDWSAVGSSFVQFAEKVPEALTAITEFIKSPAGVLLGIGAAGLGADLLSGGIARGAAAGVASGAVRGLFDRGGLPPTVPQVPQTDADPDGNPTKNKMKGFAIARALLAAAGVGVMAYGDEIAEFIAAEAANMSPEEIAASEVVDTGGILAAAAGGALTFGSLFGPKGALAGLIIGGAVGITRKVAEVIGRSNEEAALQALAEKAARLQEQADARARKEADRDAAQKMLDDYARNGKEMSPEMRANLERRAAYKHDEIDNSQLESDTNQEIGEQYAKAKQTLANRQKSGPSFRTPMPGGGFVDERDLSAIEMAEIEAEFVARNTELEAEIETIRQVIQDRIANSAGKLSERDFIYESPKGIVENVKALFGQNSLDRLADRENQALEMLERIETARQHPAYLGRGQGFTYIDSSTAVGGTSVQHVNASKGSTTSIASSVVGGGGGGGRSKTLILTAGSD